MQPWPPLPGDLVVDLLETIYLVVEVVFDEEDPIAVLVRSHATDRPQRLDRAAWSSRRFEPLRDSIRSRSPTRPLRVSKLGGG